MPDADTGETVAHDAATVVLVRDGDGGPEVLLMRRNQSAGFVPGTYVFPGGAVDPSDRTDSVFVRGLGAADADRLTGARSGGLAFWVAAVRECLEEAGVAPATVVGRAVAHTGSMSPQQPGTATPRIVDLSPWRSRVHDGSASLGEALADAGAGIDAASIRCFARWVTPVFAPRRFDTRFFVAAVPADVEVEHDGHEIVSHVWMSPRSALDRAAMGSMPMILPTIRTLAALDAFGDAAGAVEGLHFGEPAEPLIPEVLEELAGRRLVVLRSDPEANGGIYDGDTGMPAS